jgi:hypothetical protein
MRTAPAVLVVLLAAVIGAAPLRAQSSREAAAPRAPSVRMRDTAIVGERPTPDVFFIVPAGRPADLSLPPRRDYRAEILEPVVKPWLEKEGRVDLASIEHVSTDPGGWSRAFGKAAPPSPAPAPVPVFQAPPPAIPPAALARPEGAISESLPRTGGSATPAALPPPPVAAAPAAPVPAPLPSDVPILVPPQ